MCGSRGLALLRAPRLVSTAAMLQCTPQAFSAICAWSTQCCCFSFCAVFFTAVIRGSVNCPSSAAASAMQLLCCSFHCSCLQQRQHCPRGAAASALQLLGCTLHGSRSLLHHHCLHSFIAISLLLHPSPVTNRGTIGASAYLLLTFSLAEHLPVAPVLQLIAANPCPITNLGAMPHYQSRGYGGVAPAARLLLLLCHSGCSARFVLQLMCCTSLQPTPVPLPIEGL